MNDTIIYIKRKHTFIRHLKLIMLFQRLSN